MIPHKISVYLVDYTHRELKAAASQQGLEFMARSAKDALQRPQRRAAALIMDQRRQQVAQSVTREEMRESGRA